MTGSDCAALQLASVGVSALERKYVDVYGQLVRLAMAGCGDETAAYASAAAHVVSASVCSERRDVVGVKAHLGEAFALVAPFEFRMGVAS